MVIKKIGKGSYGTVYKVRRKEDQKIYALKYLNFKKMEKKTKDATLNEIRLLCSVDNPYICGYEEAFIINDGKNICIIMEYLGGGDI